MKKFLLKIALVGSVLSLSACATIVSKSSYPTVIDSIPSHANLVVQKGEKVIFEGTTPAALTLQAGDGFFKNAEYRVTLSHKGKGYGKQSFMIVSSLDGWYIGNLVFGDILGFLIVDPATGAMYKLEDHYLFQLNKLNNKHTKNELKIYDIKNIPNDWKTHLKPITKAS